MQVCFCLQERNERKQLRVARVLLMLRAYVERKNTAEDLEFI